MVLSSALSVRVTAGWTLTPESCICSLEGSGSSHDRSVQRLNTSVIPAVFKVRRPRPGVSYNTGALRASALSAVLAMLRFEKSSVCLVLYPIKSDVLEDMSVRVEHDFTHIDNVFPADTTRHDTVHATSEPQGEL